MPSLYESSVPIFIKHIKTLTKLLQKGSDHAAVPNEQLVNSRLIADMGNFIYQIQRVSDISKGLAHRAGKAELVSIEDKEQTMEELQNRLAETLKILEGVKESNFVGEDDEVAFKIGEHDLKFTGKSYVLEFAIPNFYFHFVTAYDLLRKEGVNIGKRDYLGA